MILLLFESLELMEVVCLHYASQDMLEPGVEQPMLMTADARKLDLDNLDCNFQLSFKLL